MRRDMRESVILHNNTLIGNPLCFTVSHHQTTAYSLGRFCCAHHSVMSVMSSVLCTLVCVLLTKVTMTCELVQSFYATIVLMFGGKCVARRRFRFIVSSFLERTSNSREVAAAAAAARHLLIVAAQSHTDTSWNSISSQSVS